MRRVYCWPTLCACAAYATQTYKHRIRVTTHYIVHTHLQTTHQQTITTDNIQKANIYIYIYIVEHDQKHRVDCPMELGHSRRLLVPHPGHKSWAQWLNGGRRHGEHLLVVLYIRTSICGWMYSILRVYYYGIVDGRRGWRCTFGEYCVLYTRIYIVKSSIRRSPSAPAQRARNCFNAAPAIWAPLGQKPLKRNGSKEARIVWRIATRKRRRTAAPQWTAAPRCIDQWDGI